jgi:ABC-type multidrug transport system ATPase subunit
VSRTAFADRLRYAVCVLLEAHITLELRDLRKRFGGTVALDGCSFEVERGSMLVFLGPNGAGKTTAMRCVLGLTTSDAGEVRGNGEPIGRDLWRMVRG